MGSAVYKCGVCDEVWEIEGAYTNTKAACPTCKTLCTSPDLMAYDVATDPVSVDMLRQQSIDELIEAQRRIVVVLRDDIAAREAFLADQKSQLAMIQDTIIALESLRALGDTHDS